MNIVDVNGIKFVALNEIRMVFKNTGPSEIQAIKNISSTSKINSLFHQNMTSMIIKITRI